MYSLNLALFSRRNIVIMHFGFICFAGEEFDFGIGDRRFRACF
jgi:hypothetical protein